MLVLALGHVALLILSNNSIRRVYEIRLYDLVARALRVGTRC